MIVQEASSSGFALAFRFLPWRSIYRALDLLLEMEEPAPETGLFLINWVVISYAITKTDLRNHCIPFSTYYFLPQGSIYPTPGEDGGSATEDTREPFFIGVADIDRRC